MFTEIKKNKKIFFIGIGGIGISAAARMLKMAGYEVAGSDATENEIIDQLRQEDIAVFIPQVAENITSDYGLVVYTVAVPEDNPERQHAKELGITQFTYPQLLAKIMAGKFGIGISGTNGKTTTTALLGLIFMEAGLDPSVILGGKADYLGGNARLGESPYFIFESDEYRRAFANYAPQLAVVTYITIDHLDYYRDLHDIKSAFFDYLSHVPATGTVFINADDENSLAVAADLAAPVVSFGIENPADVMAKNIRSEDGRQIFDLHFKNKPLGEIEIFLPAKYNIYNVLAAVGPALKVGIDFATIKKAVAKFKGSWRRFEHLGKFSSVEVIADYAHTPDAVGATISAVKDFFPGKKVLTVFQPHQYSRTKNLFNDFAASFAAADKALITDIFYVRGRENPADFDVSGEKLAAAARQHGANVEYLNDKELEKLFQEIERCGYDVVLVMGAGDIYGRVKQMLAGK